MEGILLMYSIFDKTGYKDLIRSYSRNITFPFLNHVKSQDQKESIVFAKLGLEWEVSAVVQQ